LRLPIHCIRSLRHAPTCAGLVAAVQSNRDRGFPDAALFEVGQIFKGDKPEDQLTAPQACVMALPPR